MIDMIFDNPEDAPTEDDRNRMIEIVDFGANMIKWDSEVMTSAVHVRWVIPS